MQPKYCFQRSVAYHPKYDCVLIMRIIFDGEFNKNLANLKSGKFKKNLYI